jgi:hypothetical protein
MKVLPWIAPVAVERLVEALICAPNLGYISPGDIVFSQYKIARVWPCAANCLVCGTFRRVSRSEMNAGLVRRKTDEVDELPALLGEMRQTST